MTFKDQKRTMQKPTVKMNLSDANKDKRDICATGIQTWPRAPEVQYPQITPYNAKKGGIWIQNAMLFRQDRVGSKRRA